MGIARAHRYRSYFFMTTIDGQIARRSWVAKIQFPGKKVCYFGNLITDADVKQHELEAAMHTRVGEFVPDGYTVLNIIPGAIFFVPEQDAQ